MWAAGELVTAHLQLNSNQWPKSWMDLAETYRRIEHQKSRPKLETNRVGADSVTTFDVFLPASFDDISNRVQIKWDMDAARLKAATFTNHLRPFQVILLKSGKGTHYEGREPNAMVWEYLQSATLPGAIAR